VMKEGRTKGIGHRLLKDIGRFKCCKRLCSST
jgi:hypothetical protein